MSGLRRESDRDNTGERRYRGGRGDRRREGVGRLSRVRGPVSGVLPDRGGVTGSRPAERSGSSGRSSRRRPRGSRNHCQQVGRGSSGTLRRLGETRVYTPCCAVDPSERCRTDSPDSLHDMGKLVRMHFRGRGETSVRSGGVDRTHHVAALSVSSTGRGGEPVGVRVTTGRGRGWNRSSSSGGIGPPRFFTRHRESVTGSPFRSSCR